MAGQGPAPLPHIGLLLDAPAITGTFGKTLGALTSVGVGGVLVIGTTSVQLGQLTLESAVGGGDGIGYLSKSLSNLTSSGSGTVTVDGSVGKTLGTIALATSGGS